MKIIVSYYRELIAGWCLDLFMFFAPKQMLKHYLPHIMVASRSFADELKSEVVR